MKKKTHTQSKMKKTLKHHVNATRINNNYRKHTNIQVPLFVINWCSRNAMSYSNEMPFLSDVDDVTEITIHKQQTFLSIAAAVVAVWACHFNSISDKLFTSCCCFFSIWYSITEWKREVCECFFSFSRPFSLVCLIDTTAAVDAIGTLHIHKKLISMENSNTNYNAMAHHATAVFISLSTFYTIFHCLSRHSPAHYKLYTYTQFDVIVWNWNFFILFSWELLVQWILRIVTHKPLYTFKFSMKWQFSVAKSCKAAWKFNVFFNSWWG